MRSVEGRMQKGRDLFTPHSAIRNPQFSRDVDFWGATAAELDGITDQVLEQLGELGGISHDYGQRASTHQNAALLNRDFEIVQHAPEDEGAIGSFPSLTLRADARIG